MKKKYLSILLLITVLFLSVALTASAQKAKKKNLVTIESIVTNENGTPVAGANIFGNEGTIIATSDETGKFKIAISDQSDLLIEAKGFEPTVFKQGELLQVKKFTINSSVFQYSQKEKVNVAFRTVDKGDISNAVSTIDPVEILKYDNIQDIGEAMLGRMPGLLGNNNLRGIGTMLFIVDGLPRDIGTINMAEVEQITVLKDINAAILYGNAAVNGVVLITTKRGEAHKKDVKVTGFYGLSVPRALPHYLSSADYMTYNNEARVNDGLAPNYSASTIENYRSGNPYRYPNVDYYNSQYLKSYKPFSKIMTELSGGNDVTRYYSNIGWEQNGSLLDFGAGKNGKQNRFNIRGNVDIKINSWVKSALDAVAIFDNTKGPISNYWSEASTRQPHLYAPLLPISLINANDPLLNSRKNDVDGRYLLGGTSSNRQNAFADGYAGGENENIRRTFSFNNRVTFDLSQITQGLTLNTNVSFDFHTRYDQSVRNTYSVYQPNWHPTNDSITSLTQFGSDSRSGSQDVGNSYYERRFGFYGNLNYDRTFNTKHHVTGSLLGYSSRYKVQNDFQGRKDVNLGLRVGYIYDKKYMVDFSSAYVNSVKLPEGNRGALSPSLGLAWVMTGENFMKNISWVDYLKVKASAGLLNSDYGIDGFYYYDEVYTRSGSYSWYEGTWSNSGTVSSYGGNKNLGYEKRTEINLGFEATLFKKSVTLDGNFFTSAYGDQITRPSTAYPSFFANYIPYENFDKNSYTGAELGIGYNKKIGDFEIAAGLNLLYATSKVVKKDEIYANAYQYRQGSPVDARFGLVSQGFYVDDADIARSPVSAFGKVKPGDIKYVDQNEDGIVDANDEVKIGRWQAPWSMGLNLRLSYKSFSIFASGTGRKGADGIQTNDYYWVDGNDKYSTIVLNRWTPATAQTATYPRLSSVANNNNFRTSSFWLYKDDYFNLDRLQLTYQMPEKLANALKMKNLSVFTDASNLVMISKYRKIRDTAIGAEPYYRSFSLGVKTTF